MKEIVSKIVCVSTKLGIAPLELLEALTVPEKVRIEILNRLRNTMGISELIYIATCNRVEFLAVMSEKNADATLLRNGILDFFFGSQSKIGKVNFEPGNFRLFSGKEAIRHIFEMAASIDSIVVGESQILGQLKDAHRVCRENGLTGLVLERLLAASYKAAKMVRSETELGQRPVSMASLVALRLGEILKENPDAAIAIVGSGLMTPKMAEIVKKKSQNPLLFVNRTPSKVEPTAQKYGGRVISLTEFLNGEEKVDIIISSTSSPEPIFTLDRLTNLMKKVTKLYAFDLAIPRDFAANVSNTDNFELWNLERLNHLSQANRRERFRTLDQAYRLIDNQVRLYLQKEFTQMISPLFDSALDESMTMAEEGLANLFKDKLSHLSSSDQELLLYWSKKVLSRACYLPARNLAEHLASSEADRGTESLLTARNAR